jgi:uncharacterized protein YbjT (DUF2867 family)
MAGGILVTGATGNVGAPLLGCLEDAGATGVRAAVRDPAKLGELALRGATPVAFDFNDPRTFGPALENIGGVFLMRPPAVTDIRGTIDPFVRAAKAAGVRRVVVLSLQGAEKNRLVPHAKMEASVAASGIPWTFLRAGFFMQNLSTTHRADIVEHDEIFVPAGAGKTAFIDTRDIAAVAAKALLDGSDASKAHDLTGSEALGYAEVAATFSEVLGRRIRYADPSPLRFAARWLKRGASIPYIAVMTAIYTVARLGLAGRVTSDVTELLGRPPIKMRRFAEEHRHVWKRN